MRPLTKREMAGAWLRYYRWQTWMRYCRAVRRCPECRLYRGHHRFGCTRRPGRGLQFNMRSTP